MESRNSSHVNHRSFVLAFIGLAAVTFAVAAGRLGLAAFPALRIAQLLLGTAGLLCFVPAIGAPGTERRKWLMDLARSQTALLIGSTLAGLLLCEILSLTMELVRGDVDNVTSNQTRREMQNLLQPVADPKLELRLAPYAGGHDAKGFRNDRVPEKAEIVAIGDSQTWGINANRSEAWPQTLQRLAGRTVYNMALGSYGPVHYWVLTDEALALSPKVIVVGLFLGNDLWDAYRMVYSLGLYPQFREPNPGADLLVDTVASRYRETVRQAQEFRARFHKPSSNGTWYDFLRSHSAFARVFYERGIWPARGRREYEDYELNRAWAAAYPEQGTIYDSGNVRTVFMTGQHLLGLDLQDSRISEGLRISKEMLAKIQRKTAAANSRLLVLLIPTKELVYYPAMKALGRPLDPTYARVVEMETRIRRDIISSAAQNGIQCVDPVPALQDAIVKDEQIYPWTGDSHFMPSGYSLLAGEVNTTLKKLTW